MESDAKIQEVSIDDVMVKDRVRSDLGDIDNLIASVRDYGIIQPIVLVEFRDKNDANHYYGEIRLVAGGRRLEALRRLGVKTLEHSKHFVWRDEVDPLRLRAMELEENLKRKELTWQEVVNGKKLLLETMQSIHGVAESGGRTREELRSGESQGFGVRKLAAMLGESPASTSRDIQIAQIIEKVPFLGLAESKGIAFRKATSIAAYAHLLDNKKSTVKDFALYEGDFRDFVDTIATESVDLILTDLPYGSNANEQHRLVGKTMTSFDDSHDAAVALLPDVAKQSYRLLRPNRFAVFFFGFAIYRPLVDNLLAVGFKVNTIPAVWVKNSAYSENPHMFYSNAYEPILVAMKGTPLLIRQGQPNVLQFGQVSRTEKIHLAQKPVELLQRIIEDMTLAGATVADLMCGSGSTGEAALKLKRRAILFEKSPASCNITRARLEAL